MWRKIPNLLNILQSKASIHQMLQGKIHLAIVAISPLERALGATGVIPFITKVSKLDKKLLFKIYRGHYHYFDLLQQEIEFIGAFTEKLFRLKTRAAQPGNQCRRWACTGRKKSG